MTGHALPSMLPIGTRVQLVGPCWMETFRGLAGTIDGWSITYKATYHVVLDHPPTQWSYKVMATAEQIQVIP